MSPLPPGSAAPANECSDELTDRSLFMAGEGGRMFFLAPVGGKNFADPTIKKSTKKFYPTSNIS